MACRLCDIAKGGNAKRLYQDDKIIAFLSDHPANPGHTVILPLNHFTILEQVPDDLLSHAYVIANKLSALLVEAVNATGINLLVNNGVSAGQDEAHFSIHLIPRFADDGIDLSWKAKQISQEQLASIELKLTQAQKPAIKAEEPHVEHKDNEAEDYLTSCLERIP